MHKKYLLLLGNANTLLKDKYITVVPVIQIVSVTLSPLISHHYMSFIKLKYSLNCREQHYHLFLYYI